MFYKNLILFCVLVLSFIVGGVTAYYVYATDYNWETFKSCDPLRFVCDPPIPTVVICAPSSTGVPCQTYATDPNDPTPRCVGYFFEKPTGGSCGKTTSRIECADYQRQLPPGEVFLRNYQLKCEPKKNDLGVVIQPISCQCIVYTTKLGPISGPLKDCVDRLMLN